MTVKVPEREYTQEYVDWIQGIAADLETSDEQRTVTAMLALVELTFSKGVPIHLGRQLVDSLLAKLTQNAVIARSAAWALYWLCGGHGQGRQNEILAYEIADNESVLNALKRDDLDPTVAAFLLSIRQIPHANRDKKNDIIAEQIGPRLLSSLESPDAVTRGNAVFALDMIHYDGAIDAHISRFQDDDAYVRKIAIRALRNLASRETKLSEHQMAEAILLLIERMQEDGTEIPQVATDALQVLMKKERATDLLPMLKHEKQSVRQRATQLLLKLDCEEMINSFAPEALLEYKLEEALKPVLR